MSCRGDRPADEMLALQSGHTLEPWIPHKAGSTWSPQLERWKQTCCLANFVSLRPVRAMSKKLGMWEGWGSGGEMTELVKALPDCIS